jgi:hypothetical protein
MLSADADPFLTPNFQSKRERERERERERKRERERERERENERDRERERKRELKINKKQTDPLDCVQKMNNDLLL